jgi:hypothetical protein
VAEAVLLATGVARVRVVEKTPLHGARWQPTDIMLDIDISMAKQSFQTPSPLDDGTTFTLPRLHPTETETEVIVTGYHIISEEVRGRFGDILIDVPIAPRPLFNPYAYRIENEPANKITKALATIDYIIKLRLTPACQSAS